MHKIQCVSLPRSGHNLLVRHLQKYFRSNQICVPQSKRPKNIFGRAKDAGIPEASKPNNEFHYCEYYYSCRQTPCESPFNTFQKSHDFDLGLRVDPNQKYVVQFRTPLGLLISWYEMRLPKKREIDSASGFLKFVERNLEFLDAFRKKWIESTIVHRLLIDYDRYLEKPAENLSLVIQFFDESHEVDNSRVNEIIQDVKPAKNNTEFRYYKAVAKLKLEFPFVSSNRAADNQMNDTRS